jgi:hypothetical protein
VLAKPGPLDPSTITDLRPYLETVPDPRSARGRWYSLTAVLLVCACAVLSGAKSIDELAEWGQQAEPCWRRSASDPTCSNGGTPSTATIDRILTLLDGDALDRAVCTWLAARSATDEEPAETTVLRAVAVDGKTLPAPRTARASGSTCSLSGRSRPGGHARAA